MKNFKNIYEAINNVAPKKISVAAGADSEVLSALLGAYNAGIAEAVLVGDTEEIQKAAQGIDISHFEIVHEPDPLKVPATAVKLVSQGDADIVMKGLLQSSDFLRAVLNREYGLRKEDSILSAISVFEIPKLGRFLFITDPGLNIAPNLEEKQSLINNAVDAAIKMGVKMPKVGVLSAVETVNPKMPSTLEAAELASRNKNGEIKNCIVAGPVSLDIAVSPEAAKHKGYDNPVGGNADILVVPTIETGNILYKSLTCLGGYGCGGLIAGTSAPVVFTSRADSAQVKLNTIALAVYMSLQS